MAGTLIYLGKSKKYKNVYCIRDTSNTITFRGVISIKGVMRKKEFFKTDREAALWVDKELLANGKEPVNILKRKM